MATSALTDAFDDIHAAPLLCAGLIGYRAFKLAGESPVVRLATTHRFGAGIRRLATALRDGSVDDVLTALRAGSDEVEFVESEAAHTGQRGAISKTYLGGVVFVPLLPGTL